MFLVPLNNPLLPEVVSRGTGLSAKSPIASIPHIPVMPKIMFINTIKNY